MMLEKLSCRQTNAQDMHGVTDIIDGNGRVLCTDIDYDFARHAIKAVNFYNDNHPPAGAVRSKVGVRAGDILPGEWYFVQRAINSNRSGWFKAVPRKHGLIPFIRGSIYTLLSRGHVVYPIASEEEAGEAKQ